MNRTGWVVLGVGAAAGLFVALAGLFSPVLRLPTHEFSQLFAAVGAVVLYYVAAWTVQTVHRQDDTLSPPSRMRLALTLALNVALAAAVVALAVLYVANRFGPPCRIERGLAFFWITWIPASALAIVLGCISGERGWGRWKLTGALGVFVILSALYDVSQALFGWYIADFLLGEPLAFDQRADMSVSSASLYQRAMVLLFTAGVWFLAIWRSGRRWASADPEYRATIHNARNRAVLFLGTFVVIALVAGSHVRLGWGFAALHDVLSEERRSEHLIVRFSPGGDAANRIDGAIRAGERWVDHLRTEWSVELREPIRIYLFDSYPDLKRLTGYGAHARLGKIFMTASDASDDIFLHELVHAMHVELDPRWTVVVSRGMLEGLAMAYGENYVHYREAHAVQASMLENGGLPKASTLMSLTGFLRVRESQAYEAAGSFVGFLIQRYGMDRFKKLQRTLDYAAAYGKSLDELDLAWREFLRSVPSSLEKQSWVAEKLDTDLYPAYFEEQCPKLGQQDVPKWRRARSLWEDQDYETAHRLYDELYREKRKVLWAYMAARCLNRLDRHDEALSRLDEVLVRTDLADHERDRLLAIKRLSLMKLEEWSALYAVQERLIELERDTSVSTDRSFVLDCLKNPALRSEVAEALTTGDAFRRYGLLQELVRQHPQDVAVRYLFVTRGIGFLYFRGLHVPPAIRKRVTFLVRVVEENPESADQVFRGLSRFVERAIFVGEFELAESAARTLANLCQDPAHRFEAGQLLDRIEFERNYARKPAVVWGAHRGRMGRFVVWVGWPLLTHRLHPGKSRATATWRHVPSPVRGSGCGFVLARAGEVGRHHLEERKRPGLGIGVQQVVSRAVQDAESRAGCRRGVDDVVLRGLPGR